MRPKKMSSVTNIVFAIALSHTSVTGDYFEMRKADQPLGLSFIDMKTPSESRKFVFFCM